VASSGAVAAILAQLVAAVLPGGTPLAVGERSLVLASALALTAVVCEPEWGGGSSPGASLTWGGITGFAAFALLAANSWPPSELTTLLSLSGGVALLCLASSALVRSLAIVWDSRERARLAVLAGLALAGALPVWLGPLAERMAGHRPELASAIASANPLAYLAQLAGVDYLRTQWFYSRSPLGSLRVAPSPTAVVSAGLLVLAGLALALERRLPRPRR
jgi:hypothetical protein